MSTYLGMQPESYCTRCGAPMYQIFERMCPTCCCSAPISVPCTDRMEDMEPEPRMTYEGKCPHCGGAMYRNARGSLHSCPLAISDFAPISVSYTHSTSIVEQDTLPMMAVTRSTEIEEVTNDRAARICIMVYESIWEHQRACEECKRYRDMGMICFEQMSLWKGLEYWEQHVDKVPV